jgi:hypothetical protein
MTYLSPLVFILPGAGAESIDRSLFRAGREDSTRFETIAYPGWQRIVDEGLSAEVLISELAAQIMGARWSHPDRRRFNRRAFRLRCGATPSVDRSANSRPLRG